MTACKSTATTRSHKPWALGLALAMMCVSGGQVFSQENEPPAGWPDINAGRSAFNLSCASCHSLEAGKVITGPSLARIYGRRAGSEPNFAYSEPLQKLKITWSEDTLDTYLRNPFNMGTQVNMMIHGLVDKKMRTDLIAYLKHDAR